MHQPLQFASKHKKDDDTLNFLPQLPMKRIKQSWNSNETPVFFNGQTKLNEIGQQSYNLIEELNASKNLSTFLIYTIFNSILFTKLLIMFLRSFASIMNNTKELNLKKNRVFLIAFEYIDIFTKFYCRRSQKTAY